MPTCMDTLQKEKPNDLCFQARAKLGQGIPGRTGEGLCGETDTWKHLNLPDQVQNQSLDCKAGRSQNALNRTCTEAKALCRGASTTPAPSPALGRSVPFPQHMQIGTDEMADSNTNPADAQAMHHG